MYLSRGFFRRWFNTTMDQLMDERGTNRLEIIMKDPEMKKRLLDLDRRLKELGKS